MTIRRGLVPLLLLGALLLPARAVAAGPRVERGLVYGSREVAAQRLDLWLPDVVRGKPPLLVWIHGGGWRAGSRRRNGLAGLVRAGYAVASLDYRLSGEATWPAQIQDCKGAIRWLRAHADRYGYDAARIGVAGSSAGGHLAALLGTSGDVAALEGTVGGNAGISSRVQAVYDLYGPTDLAAIGAQRDPTRPDPATSPEARLLGGPVDAHPDAARAASPLTWVSADDPPFLIAHGDADRLVPLAQSRALAERLRAAGVSAALRVLRGAGHGGRAFADRGLQAEVLAFFRRTVGPGAQTAPPRTPTAPRAPTGPTAPTRPATPPRPAAPPRRPGTPRATPAAADLLATYAQPGPLAVHALPTTVLHDPARDKDLQVRVTWPDADGTYPVIVWSHGAYGSKDNYQPLVRHWASHGYVVVQPTHFDSLSLGLPRRLDRLFANFADRPRDVHFLLDRLATLRARMTSFRGDLDPKRIGVGGHSFGAHTAQLVGGATTVDAAGKRTSHRDRRVDAVLLISPQGAGGELDAHSWDTLTLPTLVITGTLDRGRGGQPYTWRVEPFERAPAGHKYLALVVGARHGFGGISGARLGRRAGGSAPAQVAAVQALTLLFWDAQLKASPRARAALASRELARESNGLLQTSAR
jgi:acetyl esterase/lipase